MKTLQMSQEKTYTESLFNKVVYLKVSFEEHLRTTAPVIIKINVNPKLWMAASKVIATDKNMFSVSIKFPIIASIDVILI